MKKIFSKAGNIIRIAGALCLPVAIIFLLQGCFCPEMAASDRSDYKKIKAGYAVKNKSIMHPFRGQEVTFK